MGLFDIFKLKADVQQMQNVDKGLPDKANLQRRANFYKTQQLRARQTVTRFRIAQRAWENPLSPQRKLMYDIYRDCLLDTQVISLVNTRIFSTTSAKFRVVDKEGAENPQLTKLFKTKWFYDFLGSAVDTNMWGFTLHQLGPLKDDKFEYCSFIDRYYVKPEQGFKIVTENTSDLFGYDYTKYPASLWTIPDGTDTGKGILEPVSLIYLYKRWALSAWSEYAEIYGQPTRIGKIEGRDEETFNNMVEMLSNMGSNTWGVFNKEDEIEFIDTMKSGTGETVFERLANYCDEQIAKAVLGQTMTSSDGSSRSQAEVHERIASIYILSDQKEIEFVVNGELIPRMIQIGQGGEYAKLQDHEFQFFYEENVSLKERSEIDSNIVSKMGKKLSNEYIEKTYNVELSDEIEEDEEDDNEGMSKIENAYKQK